MVIYLPVCISFPLFLSARNLPRSEGRLALWDIFGFQRNFFLSPFYLLHFDLKHSDWRHQLFCVLVLVWYGIRHVWVFLCGIYLASNLTAFCCVIHRGLCLHTSDDVLGTGLSELHNRSWLCPEPFKQLLVISPPAASCFGWVDRSSYAYIQPSEDSDHGLGNCFPKYLFQSCLCYLHLASGTMMVNPFRYRFLGIKAFLAPAVLCGAFCVVCPVSAFSFYLRFHLEGSESAKCWSRAPSFPTVLVFVFISLTLFLAHTGVSPAWRLTEIHDTKDENSCWNAYHIVYSRTECE